MRTYKYRIYPTEKQIAILEQYMDTSRRLFNRFLSDRINEFELKKHLIYQDNCKFHKDKRELEKIKQFMNINDVSEIDMLMFTTRSIEALKKYQNEQYREKMNSNSFKNFLNINDLLAKDIKLFIRKFNKYTQAYELKELREKNHYLAKIPRTILDEIPERVHKSFNNFFNVGSGYPRFKKYGSYNSIRYRNSCKAIVEDHKDLYHSKNFSLEKNKLFLSKFTDGITIILHRPLPKFIQMKNCFINKKGNKWFVCIVFQYYQKEPLDRRLSVNKSVGIDLGIINLMVLSSKMNYTDCSGLLQKTDTIDNPRFLKEFAKRIARTNRELSRKQKMSFKQEDIDTNHCQGKNRVKALMKLQKTYDKLFDKKNYFLYNLTTQIVRQFDYIFIEDLDIKKMVKLEKKKSGLNHKHGERALNRGFNKALLDASLYRIRQMLINKAEELGKKVFLVKPEYTTIDCSNCGEKIYKSLSTRTHKCYNCGLLLDRDKNASRNILQKGLAKINGYSSNNYGMVRRPNACEGVYDSNETGSVLITK